MDPDLFMKVADIAEANGVRPELALAQMRQESSGNANAVSNKGAQGFFS
jgi:soluble lytic murein transglycosylase-like protein